MDFEDSSIYDAKTLIDILSEMVTEYLFSNETEVNGKTEQTI